MPSLYWIVIQVTIIFMYHASIFLITKISNLFEILICAAVHPIKELFKLILKLSLVPWIPHGDSQVLHGLEKNAGVISWDCMRTVLVVQEADYNGDKPQHL